MFVVLCILMFAVPAVWAIAYSSYEEKQSSQRRKETHKW